MSEISDMHPVNQFIVIDDDNATLFLCKIIIQRTFKDIKITEYNNPKVAIDYFKTAFSSNPVKTVLLLDINMPEVSGWDVLDSIFELDTHIKEAITIIMLSSSIDPKDAHQALNHPLVLGYLEKPLTISRLEEVMEKMKTAMIL